MVRAKAPPPSRRPRRSAPPARALEAIRSWHARFDPRAALAHDPLRFARRYADRQDREVSALLAALMAFGRVGTILAKLDVLLGKLAPSPGAWATERSPDELTAALAGFRHRTFRGEDIARLLVAAGALMRRDGGLFVSLERHYHASGELREALARWTGELRAQAWPRGSSRAAKHLLPDPRGPSASKRLLLLARWITREDDGTDLGLAALPPRALVVPLDVHVHRIARNLGLTRRRDASWRTAEEVTAALRVLDPEDPVRFDMAVCHLGIAQHCPSRRDPVRCEGCALRPVCLHWTR